MFKKYNYFMVNNLNNFFLWWCLKGVYICGIAKIVTESCIYSYFMSTFIFDYLFFNWFLNICKQFKILQEYNFYLQIVFQTTIKMVLMHCRFVWWQLVLYWNAKQMMHASIYLIIGFWRRNRIVLFLDSIVYIVYFASFQNNFSFVSWKCIKRIKTSLIVH